jgi:hypothetical protein
MLRDEQAFLQAYRARERPERLFQNLEEMRREGQVPDDVYGPLRQEYLDTIETAGRDIARLRQGLRNQLSDTQEELSQKRRELERLGNRYKYGDLPRVQYEKSARAFELTIASLHNRAEWLRALSDAQTAEEVERLAIVSPKPLRASRTGVKSPASEPSRHRRLLTVAAVLAVLLAVAAVAWWALPSMKGLLPLPGQTAQQALEVVTGERVDVTTQQVGASGGTVSVNGTGTPLDGLSLELPQGAFEAPVSFNLGYSPIEKLDAGDGIQAISPLIHVDSDTGEYADDLIALTVPVDVPEGHFAMAFVYDEELDLLRPLPTLEETDGTLTALSRHFCPIVMLSAPYERFLPKKKEEEDQPGDLEALKIGTGFVPGRDTWNLVNAGSCVATGGYCNGMSVTSLYYYMVEGRITGQPLWKNEYDNGLPEGMGTPGFWQDDRWAIELCSVVNGFGATRDAGRVMDRIAARVNELTPERKLENLERQFYMTAFALHVTKEPQLLSVRESATGGSGHSLLCYGVDGTTLFIADPNYPDKKDIPMAFQKGALGPYKSAQSTQALKAGDYTTYHRVYYQGDIYFYNLGKLATLWTDYESGSIDAGFPQYTIRATELDEQGAPLRTYELDREMSNRSATRRLRFELDSVLNRRLLVYEYGVTLTEGDNYLGFYVEEEVIVDRTTQEKRWEWAGFDWVSISVQDREEGESRSYYCEITVDFDGVFIDKGSGEEERTRRSIEVSAFGRFSGGTFTADWNEQYETSPGYPECSGYTGHISVSVDPDTLRVMDFDFWNEHSYTYNGLERYGATGSGLGCVRGFDESHLHCSGGSGEGLEAVQIAWEDNPSDFGEDPGLYHYELVSADNFDVLIDLIEMEPEPGQGIPLG